VLTQYYNKPNNQIHNNIVETIQPLLDNLTRINFTGGEPLIIKENFVILEHLINTGRTDVKLLITTNASTTNPVMIKMFRQFKDIHFTISLDGVDAVAEYIRHGTKWSRVSSNIDKLLDLNHSVTINCTLSSYSVLDLAKLVRYFINLKAKYDTPLEIMFSVVQLPAFLYPGSLPPQLKNKAVDQLDQAIGILKTVQSNPPKYLETLVELKSTLESTSTHGKTNAFINFTKTTDQIRGQNFKIIFGELV
jgi:MoaA/NifB/PqqE/SkfB family radical SAM enzyme